MAVQKTLNTKTINQDSAVEGSVGLSNINEKMELYNAAKPSCITPKVTGSTSLAKIPVTMMCPANAKEHNMHRKSPKLKSILSLSVSRYMPITARITLITTFLLGISFVKANNIIGIKTLARQVRKPALDTVVYFTPNVMNTKTINKIPAKAAPYLTVFKFEFFSFFQKTIPAKTNAMMNLKAMRLNSSILPKLNFVSKVEVPQNIATINSIKSAFI